MTYIFVQEVPGKHVYEGKYMLVIIKTKKNCFYYIAGKMRGM